MWLVVAGLVEEVLGELDGDCELWCGSWVIALVPAEHVAKWGPVGFVGPYLVGGVGLEVQFEGLADGAKRVLN